MFIKDPDAVLDYSVDWEDWLPAGERIESSSWIVPAAISIVAEQVTATKATAVVGGGVSGERYSLVNRIVTSTGKQQDRTILLTIREA
jgi:hypothetical protein